MLLRNTLSTTSSYSLRAFLARHPAVSEALTAVLTALAIAAWYGAILLSAEWTP